MGSGRGGIRPAPADAPSSTAQLAPSPQCRNWEEERWGGPGPAPRGGNWSFAWLRPFLLVNGFLVALAAAVDRLEAAMGPSLLACLAACALRDAAVVAIVAAFSMSESVKVLDLKAVCRAFAMNGGSTDIMRRIRVLPIHEISDRSENQSKHGRKPVVEMKSLVVRKVNVLRFANLSRLSLLYPTTSPL